MSIDFTAASSQYLDSTNPPVTTMPFTVSTWFQVNDRTVWPQSLVCLGQGSVQRFVQLEYSSFANDGVILEQYGTATGIFTGVDLAGGANISNNTWYFAAMSITSSTSRWLWFAEIGSPVEGGNDLQTEALPTINNYWLGAQDWSFQRGYLDGKMAHTAVWGATLTQQEIQTLANGANPLQVRPASLVSYYPLNVDSNLLDVVTGEVVTNNGGAVDSPEEPPVARSVVTV